MAIQNTVANALDMQLRTIRIPAYMLKARWEVDRTVETLTRALQREPGVAEIAAACERTEAEVVKVLGLPDDVTSLDAPAIRGPSDPNERTLASEVPVDAPDPADGICMEEEVAGVLNALTSRERHVLHHHYGLDDRQISTLEEISKDLSVTRERVRQIEQGAIDKVRRAHGLTPVRPRRRSKARPRPVAGPVGNWITLREAADLVNVSKQTVRSWLGKTGLDHRWHRRGSGPVIEVPIDQVALIGAVLDWVEDPDSLEDGSHRPARRLWNGFSIAGMRQLAPPGVQDRYRAYVSRARRRTTHQDRRREA